MGYENRPGGPMPESMGYQPRVDTETGKEIGFTTPDGKSYLFNEGESLVQRLEGEDRNSYIHTADDGEMRVEDWIAKQEKASN